jgi:hypothetical protein
MPYTAKAATDHARWLRRMMTQLIQSNAVKGIGAKSANATEPIAVPRGPERDFVARLAQIGPLF